MKFSYNTPLVIDPITLRQGASDPEQATRELKRHQAIVQARLRVEIAAKEHLYKAKTLEGTLEAYAELYLSQALTWAIRCAATKDAEHFELTNHARRYWLLYRTADSTAPYDSGFTQPSYPLAGHIGSLAHQVVLRPDLYEPIEDSTELLELTLVHLWSELKMSLKSSPRRRLLATLKRIGWNRAYFESLEAALTRAYQEKDPIFARFFLGVDAFDNLPERVLLGEIDDELVEFAENLQLQARSNSAIAARYGLFSQPKSSIKVVLTETLKIGRSGGVPLLLMAYTVEGLIRARKLILRLPEALRRRPIQQLYRSGYFPEVFYLLAENVALASDAQRWLATFQTHEGAKERSDYYLMETQRWLALSGVSNLPLNNECRLGAF